MLPLNLNDVDVLINIDECKKYVYLAHMDNHNRILLGQRMTKELFGYLHKRRVFSAELTVIESENYTIIDRTEEEYGADYPDRYCVEIFIPITTIDNNHYDNILHEYIETLISKIKEAYVKLNIDYSKNQLDLLDIDSEWSVNSQTGETSKKIYFK